MGCETAHFLAMQSKKVTIIEMLDEIASDVEVLTRICLLQELSSKNVTILTRTKIIAITPEGAIVIDGKGSRTLLKADTIVLALGTQSLNVLERELVGKVSEIYTIGDAREPRKIADAISEGYFISSQL